VAIVQSGSFFGYNVSKCSPYTSYKNQVLNETMAPNSASQLIKDDLLLHAVQLFSILCCGPDFVEESNLTVVHSVKGHGFKVTVTSVSRDFKQRERGRQRGRRNL